MTARNLGRMAIVACVVAAVPGAAVRAATDTGTAAPAQIGAVRISETEGTTVVTIGLSRRAAFTTWKLGEPARIVVDISGVRLGDLVVPFDAGTFAVGAISGNSTEDAGGPRVRIMLTLRQPAEYHVSAQGNDILISVEPHARPPAVPANPANEIEAKRLAVERTKVEEERRSVAAGREKNDAAARKVAEDKVAVEQRRVAMEAAGRAAAQVSVVESERLAREKQSLEGLRRQIDARAGMLDRAESELRKSQQEAGAARRREEDRGDAVRAAAAEVEERRKTVEANLSAQKEQKTKLQAAAQLVAAREAAVKAAAAALALREKSANEAVIRLAEAQKAGASEQARAEAARNQEKAESERKMAADADARSRKDLQEAVAARRDEEARKQQIEKDRIEEERRLKLAVEARAAEDAKRADAEQRRRVEEDRLAFARSSRAKVEAERDALLLDMQRLKSAARSRPTVAAVATVPPSPVVAAVPAPPSPPPQRVVTISAPTRVRRIDFVDDPARSSVIIDLDEPPAFVVERAADHRQSLHLFHAELPHGLERSLDATEFLGPVRLISSYRDPADKRTVRVDVDLAEDVPSQVRQVGNRLYWDFAKTGSRAADSGRGRYPLHRTARVTSVALRAVYRSGFISVPGFAAYRIAENQTIGTPAAAMRPATPGKKRYTGRRIDLDMKGADIHNILRLLSDVGGVNIVTSDDVKGEVTIKMKDVPWDQALDVVLRAKLLGQVREGNLIRVAPLQVLEKELEQEIARQKQITDILPTETRLIGVSYADAKALQDRAKDLLSTRGKISVDERTNTLIVSDVAKNLALVEELVRNLDTQTSMVVIEARIVEAQSNFSRQLGIQWGGTGFLDAEHANPTGLAFPFNIGVAGGATDSATNISGLVPGPRSGTTTASPNFAVNLPAPAGQGSGGALGVTLGSIAGAFNLNLRLSASEASGQVRIVSSPRISTMDNVEASIEQGVAIPISTVSAQGVQTVFVDARLILTVKPHVTNEGTVALDIKVTRNEPDFVNTGARGDPTITKKEAKTSMLVRDGDTAVIGGIYSRNSGLGFVKVPFFADIPVIGVLFRSRKENDSRTEFLVFITPRIANRARALGQ